MSTFRTHLDHPSSASHLQIVSVITLAKPLVNIRSTGSRDEKPDISEAITQSTTGMFYLGMQRNELLIHMAQLILTPLSQAKAAGPMKKDTCMIAFM